MKLIDNSLFDKIILESLFENVDESLLVNPSFSDDFKKYLLIERYPSKFRDAVPLQLYYNKYYYFLKFLVKYKKLVGFDEGLEQQEFKILEEGEIYPDIDWGEIESISNEIKNSEVE
ncbi:hypothetical protein [Flectobacillus longus]|uniref:hypothetical protein n=1 Tax=Flectobacillus longus TaxID=2984207 RepID=UPI0024B6B7AA|nr:hypothetical protein [Flectobacillus longus]MDI9881119.1 hypothetical protein [Flectobacillus longus]